MESSDNTVAIVAIIVTGATAVSAALIAAYAGHVQQKRALAHDTWIRDRDEARKHLDGAIGMAEALLQVIVDVQAIMRAGPPYASARRVELEAALVRGAELRNDLAFEYVRLIVRIGEGPVAEAFFSYTRALSDRTKELSQRVKKNQAIDDASETERRSTRERARFIYAVEAEFGLGQPT